MVTVEDNLVLIQQGAGAEAVYAGKRAWARDPAPAAGEVIRGDEAIAQAFADQRTDLMVEFTGRVQRTLPDELTGRPQQRFIVELDNGHLLLVSHDLNYADRVPLDAWDTVHIRGEYQWNAQGGLVSWTHRDPGIGLKHGWIDFKGRRYQ